MFYWNKEDVKRKSLSPALLLQNLSWHRLLLPVVDKCFMRNISLINVIFWSFKQKYFAIKCNNYERYFAVKSKVFGARCTQTSKDMTWTSYFLLCIVGWQRNWDTFFYVKKNNEALSFELAWHFECLCNFKWYFKNLNYLLYSIWPRQSGREK